MDNMQSVLYCPLRLTFSVYSRLCFGVLDKSQALRGLVPNFRACDQPHTCLLSTKINILCNRLCFEVLDKSQALRGLVLNFRVCDQPRTCLADIHKQVFWAARLLICTPGDANPRSFTPDKIPSACSSLCNAPGMCILYPEWPAGKSVANQPDLLGPSQGLSLIHI